MGNEYEVKAGKLKAIVYAENKAEAKRIFANSINGHGGSGKITVITVKNVK